MKKKLVIVFFIVISLFLFGCEKKNKEIVEEEKNEVRDLTEEEIKVLLGKVDELSYFDINPAKSFKTNELTNQEVLLWASSRVDVLNTSFADLEKAALDYLDFSLEPEPILCMTHSNILGTSDYLYLYNVESKSFIKNVGHINHSNDGYYSYVINRYESSKFENDNYIISVYKLFSDTNANYLVSMDAAQKRNWYYTYADAKLKQKSVIYDSREKAIEKLNELEPANLKRYTYTFKIKNDNYVLKSYQIG